MLVGEITHMMLVGEIRSLLQKLQEIWDEVGDSDEEIYKMLVQIERECLDVYKRNVEQAEKSREQFLQSLSDAKLELSSLVSALGDKTFVDILETTTGTIKQQLAAVAPIIEQLRKQKSERVKEFADVQSQIQNISAEIAGTINEQTGAPVLDESDLSRKKLYEYQSKLQELQKEKSDRLQKVLGSFSTVHDLCAVIGMDFLSTVTEVHPSLNGWKDILSKSLRDEPLSNLTNTVLALKEDKKQRLHKLQELATQIMDLWNLMDTPDEERKSLDHVTRIMSASVDEVTVHGDLAPDMIQQAAAEVERLNEMKASRIKEINVHAHTEIDLEASREELMSLSDSGNATEGVSHKTKLQEYARRLCLPFPTYQTFEEGLPSAPKLRATVCVGESYSSQDTFSKRKTAEQDAARVALKCIKEKIKNEKFPVLYEDPALCKPILNEFAAKMKSKIPTYDIVASGEKIGSFRSSLVFNGVTYTSEYAVSKKGSEQFGARAVILSLLGDPAYAMELSKIINSRAKICSSPSQVKDSCNAEHGSLPAGVMNIEQVQTAAATHKALTDSTDEASPVKRICLPNRKQLSDQAGLSTLSVPPVSEQPWGVTENNGRQIKDKREANNTLQTCTVVRWVAPPMGKVKLNTDGSVSHRHGGLAATGGVLRDSNGVWLGGFVGNLGSADVLKAELCGLRDGLLLAKLKGCRSMIVEVDSLSLTQLLLSDTRGHPLAAILEDCRVLLRELDVDRVDHTFREGNVCADFLASLGHTTPLGVHVLAQPPPGLGHHLIADMQGVGFLRQ